MKGGLCFFGIDSCFFLVLAPGGFVASVASVASTYGPGSWWLLVAPGGSWSLLVAGGSWWLLVGPVARGFRGSWWLLVVSVSSVASVASAASVASMASMAPGSSGSSIIYRSIYR